MRSATLCSLSLALIGTAQAGVITPRQASFDFECDGLQYPKQADCENLFTTFNDGTTTYKAPSLGAIDPVVSFTMDDQSNCQLDLTWYDHTYVITGNQIMQGINGVMTTCLITGTGGSANDIGDRFRIAVRNNPSYNPPNNKRDRRLSVVGKRAEGDTSFEYGVHTVNAKPLSMRHNIGSGLPGGSTWEWSKGMSVTDKVGFSTSVSAGIEGILSASLSTEISHEKTYTSGTATTITINCQDNEYGQVYFQGYAEVWQGVLQPSGEPLIVTKPTADSNGATAGFYSYDCISK